MKRRIIPILAIVALVLSITTLVYASVNYITNKTVPVSIEITSSSGGGGGENETVTVDVYNDSALTVPITGLSFAYDDEGYDAITVYVPISITSEINVNSTLPTGVTLTSSIGATTATYRELVLSVNGGAVGTYTTDFIITGSGS
jgi:hypothetical protein